MGRVGSGVLDSKILEQLEKILASKVFISAQRSQSFLRFVVEKSLLGQSPKEYEIAIEVFQRTADYDPAVDATVRVEASRLRSRLREYYQTFGKEDQIVIDIPKGGYSPVFEQSESTSSSTPTDPVPTIIEATNGRKTQLELVEAHADSNGERQFRTPPEPPLRAHVRSRRLLWISISLAFCISVAIIAVVMRWNRVRSHVTSIAVLPLQSLSADPGQDYLAAGMTDELTTELARIHNLRVASQTSSASASRSHQSIPQIAAQLNVDAVVEGSVSRSGNKIRITAQLIDAKTDKHLWAQSFEGQGNDVLSLQDTVAAEIAAHTQVALTQYDRTRLSSSHKISPEAHDDYLRGLYFIQRRDGDLAVRYFQSSLNREPAYAGAWAGLARALDTKWETGAARGDEVQPQALEAAKRAIELDPTSGEAYISLGTIEFTYLRDWSAAERDLRRGVALSPGDTEGHTDLSLLLVILNRADEALPEARLALETDPLGFRSDRTLGQILFYDRKYSESLNALQRAFEIAPDRIEYVAGWTSAVYEAQGRYTDAAQAELRGIASSTPANEIKELREALAAGGWQRYQQTRIKLLLPKSSQLCVSFDLAWSYLRLRKVGEAFRWFQRSADEHCIMAPHLASDPRVDPVRNDPRYVAYQDRLHLPH
ncbi:tetratricopeptide repeat protein [Occallatibacter savannae]|uniref:tetratricopeptide repeat protein n=1 Tax=Occallatibacter savannae TaxID=1002691 RepID=UPI000D69A97A|nr:tetratricopeptide repeat protein [Occallatibacter savannae]